MTDIWFRNAQSCMSVCAEEGVSRLTWTRQHLSRMKNDGIFFVRQFYLTTPVRPKIMLIGIQGTSEYGIFDRIDKPKAVYPTWSGKNDPWDELVDFIEHPWGEDEKKCSDRNIPSSLRPTFGQKHKVIIHNSPAANSGVGRQFWQTVRRVQDDYPEVELFINGTKSYPVLFGLDFKAGDFGLSDSGDINSAIFLPNGMRFDFDRENYEVLLQWEDWIKVLGFSVKDLITDQIARYRFKIRSVKWAAKNWSINYRFYRDGYNIAVDREASNNTFKPPQTNRIILRPRQFTTKEADKILCNRCRIAPGCRLYRQDSICTLKDSEMSDLAKHFQSRNAGLIVDGLAALLRMQATRLENSIDAEASSGEIDPDVTKQMNAVFANGVKLAKLVDPELSGPGTRVQVNVGVGAGNAQVVSQSNPKEIMASIVSSLEAQGIPREQITPKMIEGVLKGMAENSSQHAITAQTVQHEQSEFKKNEAEVRKVLEGEVTQEPVVLLPFNPGGTIRSGRDEE